MSLQIWGAPVPVPLPAVPTPAPEPVAQSVAVPPTGSDVLHWVTHAAEPAWQLEPCAAWAVREDVEAALCMELSRSAGRLGPGPRGADTAAPVELKVSVSTGRVSCGGAFTTRCLGQTRLLLTRPGCGGGPCELAAERPSLAEAQQCLRRLVYSPPPNFHGEVAWSMCCRHNLVLKRFRCASPSQRTPSVASRSHATCTETSD